MATRNEVEQKLIKKALQDPNYRQQIKANPKSVLSQELGVEIPGNITIEVVEETPTKLYIVLPAEPVEEELSEEELEAVAGGGCWIGGSRGCAFVTSS